MTFSDAEEDQPSIMQNGTGRPTSDRSDEDSRGIQSNEDSPSESQATSLNTNNENNSENASDNTLSKEETNFYHGSSNSAVVTSDSSAINSASLSTSTDSPTLPSTTSSFSSSRPTIENQENESSGTSRPNTESNNNQESDIAVASESSSVHFSSDTLVGENNVKGLGTEKVLEKLQQIHGYIQQTAAAMQALENEGDLDQGTSGSESLGVLGDVNGSGGPPSMQERLARHEVEQQQLSDRLRESLVRREELMARYQATRERLNNLKHQRLSLVQEERRLLQSVGGPENPYDDPIPGVDTWSIEQLETGIQDFQGLREKVDRLYEAYNAKMQAIDESDRESRDDLQRKIDQINNKKVQIESALTQMSGILRTRREGCEEMASQNHNETSENTPSPSTAAVNSETEMTPQSNNRAPSESIPENQGDEVVTEGATGMSPEARDLIAKQQHLQSLKEQLMSMKKLLQVTQSSRNSGNAEETVETESSTGRENSEIDERKRSESLRREGISDENSEENIGGPLIGSTIVGVNGEVIRLSETERRNPQVVSKYKQLSEAKQRLAKMEEIMAKISEARQNGKSLTEVLSPENLAILTEAREEELISSRGDDSDSRPTDAAALSRNSNESYRQEVRASSSERNAQAPKMNSMHRMQEKHSNGKNEWRNEREFSAMQSHFHKNTSGISSVNEGNKFDREKGAIKKQTRELLKDKGNDPRLMEVFALQEELKEKKNALEALMRRMGKSSSFMLDNISDNISENVSDMNSETMEKPSASWGISQSQGRYFSDQGHSDEEILNGNEELTLRHEIPQQISFSTKNRNRYPQHRQHGADHGRFSVNNLNGGGGGGGSLPKSVRPKNRYHAKSTTGTSWENVMNPSVSVNQNPLTNKVQNTVAAALSQLSQVQETINSLYGDLRNAEMSARQQQEIPALNQLGTLSMPPQSSYNVLPQSVLPSFCLSPLPNSQGRGDLGASNHILAGLQQCFSQLYLHSLEIQSLSKHLQIIDQREKSVTPSHLKESQRSGSLERNEGQQEQQQFHRFDRRANTSARGSLPLRSNHNFHTQMNHHHEDRKASSFPGSRDFMNPSSSNENLERTGVRNPMCTSLFSPQQPWQLHDDLNIFENKNLFHPLEQSASDELPHPSADLLLDSSSHFPLDTEDINEELPWDTVPSPQIQQQSSDILNNQVLPGTRANNYWDNFRSYSRQNPLSSTAKSNTGEHYSLSGSSTPGRRQSLNTGAHIQGSVTYENNTRHLNLPSCSHNSINKASDKNSSTSRSQNKSGARARYYIEQPNGRKVYVSNSSYHCNSPGDMNIGSENLTTAQKRNNRHDYEWIESPAVNHLELNRNQDCVNNEETQNPNVSYSSNPRRFSRDREENAPRNYEENVSSHNSKSRIQNSSSTQQESMNSSETLSEVVREAESLMQKHSQQPQFLLQLFHHAAKITSNTDQQVALELLKELSYQRHQNNIQHNRWASNSSVTQSDNISIPLQSRDQNFRNIITISNKNSQTTACLSGSDASESGITSDEEETKGLYQMVKNLTPTSSSVGAYPPLRSSPQVFSDPSNNPSLVGLSPIHASNSLPQNQQPQNESLKGLPKDIMNIFTPDSNKDCRKSENHKRTSVSHRKRHDYESSLRNYASRASVGDSSSAPSSCTVTPSAKQNQKTSEMNYQKFSSSSIDKRNNKKQTRKSPRRNFVKETEEKSNCDSKIKKENLKSKLISSSNNDMIQEPVSGFESLVSASLREVLLCFENADYSHVSTSQVLESLHHSIMRQVQFHSSTLGFSSNFVYSIDSQLKRTLHSFDGNVLHAIRQELAAAVTQVLIQEYCSLFLQHDNLPESSQTTIQDSNNHSDSPRPANKSNSDYHKKSSQLHKQPSSNSLFGNQEIVLKENKPVHPTWSFNPTIPAEYVQQNSRGIPPSNSNAVPHSREDDSKRDLSTNKSKGAISKNIASQSGSSSNYKEDLNNSKPVVPNGSSRDSPFPEVSSFPESWIVQRGNMNQSDVEGAYPFSESSFAREREDVDYPGRQASIKLERNDTEADQEHSRNEDFLNVSLPVHDLAEADQSQDPVEAECIDSSAENSHYETGNFKEAKEFSLKFIPKKKAIPEQGLDEVPIRLLNGIDRSSPPLVNGRHVSDENPEGMMHPHICPHFSPQASPTQAQTTNANSSEISGSNHNTDSSSGKTGLGG